MTVLKWVAFLHFRTGSMIAWRTRMFMSAPLNPSVASAISLMSCGAEAANAEAAGTEAAGVEAADVEAAGV